MSKTSLKELKKLDELINVKVSIQNNEEYEIDSCWSEETRMFCEKVAEEMKKLIELMTNGPN